MTYIVLSAVLLLVFSEIFLNILIRRFRSDFQWLVTEKDDIPIFDPIAFEKFLSTTFDSELGWVKKPNTSGSDPGKSSASSWSIDPSGSRENHCSYPTSIASFGDSYTFCRQVDDGQTWQVYLSEMLNDKVLNFGVGNYGVDQAYLYYKRQNLPKTTNFIILGFVPETICRIQSYWKHYLEFGNIFAFKPRFTLHNGKLTLHQNLLQQSISSTNIEELIVKAREYDRFYLEKFKKFQYRFPYVFWFFMNFKRNVTLFYHLFKRRILSYTNNNNDKIENAPFAFIMRENILHSHEMYSDNDACELLKAILLSFTSLAKKKGHDTLILIMPQRKDLEIIKKVGFNPYSEFYRKLGEKINILDLTTALELRDLDDLYINDSFGGHFSSNGNKLVAEEIFEHLRKKMTKDLKL